MSLEHYIATKILRSSDIINSHKLSEMISLIKHILKTDGVNAENEKITKYHDFLLNNIFSSCNNKLDGIESTYKNKNVSFVFIYIIIRYYF